ncbi:MAG: hypothetical protein RL338_1047 [Chloroflexota bacterium]
MENAARPAVPAAQVSPLAAARLLPSCDPASLPFETTAELPDLEEIVGQDRAVEAVRFAIGIRREGYNLFALGPAGIGKHTVLSQFLAAEAPTEKTPSEWAYVHDFDHPERPRALELPPGRGIAFRDAMARFATELRSVIPAAFEDERYRQRREALEDSLKGRRDAALAEIEKEANERDVLIVRTPVGVGLAPSKKGEPIGGDEFKALPEAEQERLRAAMKATEARLEEMLRQVPRWEREHRDAVRELDREVTRAAVHHPIEEIRAEFGTYDGIAGHLDAVEKDVLENAGAIVAAAVAASGGAPGPTGGDDGDMESVLASVRPTTGDGVILRRYAVNLLVDRSGTTGAPVVREDHATLVNLVGRVEYLSRLGALVTDHTMIKPGALHRANGGYLVLDARDVLTQPYAWEGLKRALRSRELRIESLGQALNLISTVSLEPEPIPLDVKVALVGDRLLYGLLVEYDPDFPELFKIAADFEEEVVRSPETDLLYARLIGTLARREGLRPLDRTAVARLIEHASRLAADAGRVSTHMRGITDLIREADHLAGDSGRDRLTAADVQRAIDGRYRRSGRVRERLGDAIQEGTILIATDGATVGQVNGLSVAQIGEVAFGTPTRITASVRLGRGDVIDIEREVELGGPIHSKGVLILAGFLGGRFGGGLPLAFHASLVFEQSYGGVEGDSASLAELCALLSALARLPIRQSFAMTGSVNQHGAVQPIGGVNEKIEGFFDVCAARGLTGDQGVIIPAPNVRNLVLRRDVVDACEAGRFRIHAVATVDEALELLTGVAAGSRDESGRYPEGTVNGLVEARLAELAESARQFAAPPAGEVAETVAAAEVSVEPPAAPGAAGDGGA